jgi:hypothetical protein
MCPQGVRPVRNRRIVGRLIGSAARRDALALERARTLGLRPHSTCPRPIEFHIEEELSK